MASGLIVYASTTGNTRRVAERIAAGLGAAGAAAELVQLGTGCSPSVQGRPFLAVGTPAAIFRPSYLLSDWLAGLPPLPGVPAFTFVTYGTELGDTANRLRRALLAKGADERGHLRLRGRNLFPGYTQRGVVFSPDSPAPEELAEAERFGARMGAHLAAATRDPAAPWDPPLHPVLRFERLVTSRPVVRLLYSRFFRARRDRCRRCLACVRACPTGNIREAAGGWPAWGTRCVFCLGCQVRCPHDAVRTPISWPVFAPFLRFNVARDRRNGIPSAPAAAALRAP